MKHLALWTTQKQYRGVLLCLSLLLSSAAAPCLAVSHYESHRDTGRRAFLQGRYEEAESLLRLALDECRRSNAPPAELAVALNDLGLVYVMTGNPGKAEPLLQEAWQIKSRTLGPDHPDVAQSLNNIAGLYFARNDYSQAEKFFLRAIAVWEKAGWPESRDADQTLDNYVQLLKTLQRMDEADTLTARVTKIRSANAQASRPTPKLDPGSSLWAMYANSGERAFQQAQYSEAERYFKQALKEAESFDPDGQRVRNSLHLLGSLYRDRQRFADAETLYERTLALEERALDPDGTEIVPTLNNLAYLKYKLGKLSESEWLYKRVLYNKEHARQPDERSICTTLIALAAAQAAQGIDVEAKGNVARVVALAEKRSASAPEDAIGILQELSEMYKHQGNTPARQSVCKRAMDIASRASLGTSIAAAAITIELARSAALQGHMDEAASQYERAIGLYENAATAYLPELAAALEELAQLELKQGKVQQAERRLQSLLDLRQQIPSRDWSGLASTACDLADVYLIQRRYGEAQSLLGRVRLPESADSTSEGSLRVARQLCRAYLGQGKTAQAKPLLEKLIGGGSQGAVSSYERATLLKEHAAICHQEGDLAAAESSYKGAIIEYHSQQPRQNEQLLEVLADYADMLRDAGRPGWASHIDACAAEVYKSLKQSRRRVARGGLI